jgi:hypothetical protein
MADRPPSLRAGEQDHGYAPWVERVCQAQSVGFVHVGSFGQEPNWFARPIPSRISEACRRAFVTALAKVRKEFDLLFGRNPVTSLPEGETGDREQ